ncbi:hypothetical protein [Listeria newyorkensis]|uniref:hypothetical protein n=1 Tax=Listeria newyorkensis TaxID=1497681 RepID=UPI0010F4339D|nr:hypothetical protein [Listeria newyorkensis]
MKIVGVVLMALVGFTFLFEILPTIFPSLAGMILSMKQGLVEAYNWCVRYWGASVVGFGIVVVLVIAAYGNK